MQKNKFKWQLINDSITDDDKKAWTDFINTPYQRFTQGGKVKEFEKAWSEWLGVNYSVFVNSGSSANLLMLSALQQGEYLKNNKVVAASIPKTFAKTIM